MAGERLIIVDEEDDSFSRAFAEHAAANAIDCRRCRLQEFSRETSIWHDGGDVQVTPACALLLRPLRPLPTANDGDTRFAWSEHFAAVWSVAALTPHPVINRPNEWGWGSRSAFSAAVTEQRANQRVRAPEVFWHGRPPEGDEAMFHQDLATWETVAEPASSAYLRSRRLPACRGWDRVIVVVDRGFRVTVADLHPWPVEGDSIRIALELGLSFAAVTWAIPEDDAPPIVARVNPFPGVHECLPVWNDVADALLRSLCA